jgi:hypothetical protein
MKNFTNTTEFILEREPTRWMCCMCGKVNRALQPVCTNCDHRRWEHLGFTIKDTLEMGRQIYSIYRIREIV